ncbi:MAG: CBS domain-containing protein [Clostridia bacterium]|nr:CBS domain-containing protein [Clostridia bacterium]
MEIVDTFLDLYRTLEEDLKEYYSGRKVKSSSLVFEYMNGDGKKYYDELDVCREIRNLLTHHSYFKGETPVYPSESIINALKEIIYELENPVTAMTVATPMADMLIASYSDKVNDVLSKMESRGFSHVPVMEGSKLVGVFSVGALFVYLRRSRRALSEGGIVISDLKDQLPIGAHMTEKYLFCDADTPIEKVSEMFASAGPKNKRVAAVFVTRGPELKRSVVGIITPWDIIKVN